MGSMSSGNLSVNIADLRARALERQVVITLRRDPGTHGAGGRDLAFELHPDGGTEAELEGIPNRGGPGSLYLLRFTSRGYLDFSFAQFITAGDQKALQNVSMVRNPQHVKTIEAPSFSGLESKLKNWLSSAQMTAASREDEDLLGKSGSTLYDALGDERKAGMLNIFAKATHTGTVGGLWEFIREPLVFRRDRCFVRADSRLPQFLAGEERFVPAQNILHDPLPGFRLSNSMKSDDRHANIQVTLQHAKDGSLAADIDIDESSGFGHWGEVLRNFFKRQRTSPYAIHELLLAADPQERTLDPGYELVLK